MVAGAKPLPAEFVLRNGDGLAEIASSLAGEFAGAIAAEETQVSATGAVRGDSREEVFLDLFFLRLTGGMEDS